MVIRSLIFLFALFSLHCLAEEVQRGKHWYERPAETEDLKTTEPAEDKDSPSAKYSMPSVPDMDILMKMHPRDLRALFEEVHEYHVMDPTLETASEVQKLKAVMSKKARAAAAVEQLAMLRNPSLSGMAENAVNPSARSVQRKERDNSIAERIRRERENYAIILLTQPGCAACQLQRNVIQSFADQFGWPVKEVDIVDSPAAQARFDIRVTPTTLIASRESGDWQTVAIGADTLPSMVMNVDRAVRLLAGEIKPEQWLTAPNQTNSLYDPNFK